MIWIIASLPFWIISLACLLVGVVAPILAIERSASFAEFRKVAAGAGIFLVASGLFALIAAKICS